MKKVCVLALALAVLLGGCAAASRSSNTDCCTRAKLLQEALDSVGVCTAEEAVDIWARGLMARSAAMQYAVMDAELRADYAKALKLTAPNWVTGVSSPWVGGYDVFDVCKTQELLLISLHVMTETSAGPSEIFLVVLALHREGSYWRIGGLCADEGLSAYTGFLE